MNEHIGELAELYALGTLDDAQRASVDSHVLTCDECAGRLGEAESAVAATIASRTPPAALNDRVHGILHGRADWLRRAAPLVAAAFVLGLLPSAFFALERPRTNDSERDAAIRAMVNSHFAHVPFTTLAPGAPKAKLVYGRGANDWRLVIAQTPRAYRVRALVNGRAVDLGALHVSGNAAELYVPPTNAREFELMDGNRPLARAMLPSNRR